MKKRGPIGEWLFVSVFWILGIAEILIMIGVLGVVGYVAHHFIAKWW